MRIKRIRMLIFLHFSRSRFIKSMYYRPLLAKWGGVKVINPIKTFIGDSVIFDTNYPDMITIEEGVYITARCIILAHTMHERQCKCGPVHIKKNAFVGCNTVILHGVTIGENAVIGASSVVTKNIPDNEIWAGNPAHFIRKNSIVAKATWA